jgi:hypothetical protein
MSQIKKYGIILALGILSASFAAQAQTWESPEKKLNGAIGKLEQSAATYIKDGTGQSFTDYVWGLKDYAKTWEDYRNQVILADFRDQYSSYQKTEEEIVVPTYNKIHFVVWLHEGADLNDPEFIMNGNDPSNPTPPWHTDPYKYPLTFEKEKATYSEMIKGMSDAEILRTLDQWKLSTQVKWDAARKPLLESLEPVLRNAYFDGQKLPHSVHAYVYLWRSSSNFHLPTNVQESYTEEISLLEPSCLNVMKTLPVTELTTSLQTLCGQGLKALPDFEKLMSTHESQYALLKAKEPVTLSGPDKANLEALVMASKFQKMVQSLASLRDQYNRLMQKDQPDTRN